VAPWSQVPCSTFSKSKSIVWDPAIAKNSQISCWEDASTAHMIRNWKV
jgi:hypothetical protein